MRGGRNGKMATMVRLPSATESDGLPGLISSVRALCDALQAIDGRLIEVSTFIAGARKSRAEGERRWDASKDFRVDILERLGRIEDAMGIGA